MKMPAMTGRMTLLATAILVTTGAGSAGAARERALLLNGGFERDADGDGMADSWQFSGDKGATAAWSRDEGFEGQFSQKLVCSAFTSLSPASHAMLCQVNTLRLEKNRWYRISFAARQQGIAGAAVQIAISNTRSWSNCGLNEAFRATAVWERFEFRFRATETLSDHIRLQFWYTSTGTLWLDDVRIEPAEPVHKRFTEVLPQASGVNLLRNSSFECGTGGWGSIADLPGWGGNLNHLVGSITTATATLHQSSFQIALTPETIPVFYFDYFPLYRVPVKAPLLASRGWIEVQPGAYYTLSAYLKADPEGLTGVLCARQALGGTLRKEVRLGTSWQRYNYAFQPQCDQVFVALGLDLGASEQEGGTIWIDGVQLEKGAKATPYQPRRTIEVAVETDQLGNVFPYGQEPQLRARIFNSGRQPQSVDLHLRTTDFDDAVVCERNVRRDVGPEEHAEIRVGAGVEEKGFYRVHVASTVAEVALTRPLRLAVITPYTQADSLFGMNHAYPWPHLLELSKRIGVCWFRDWSLKWHEVEPQKGRFEFVEADRQIDRVLEHDLGLIGLLPFPSAGWSSSARAEPEAGQRYPASRERIACMPRDPADWAAYVRQTVRHYRGRIKVWEILNEPIYTSYALPRAKGYLVEDYVRLLRAAYKAIKETDGEAMVIGGIAGSPATYTREFIEAGGLGSVDALNLHAYPGLKAPDAYEEPLRRLRRRMRQAGSDKPIWFTEGAYYADDDTPFEPFDSHWLTPVASESAAAEWQVKFNTILLAYGVEKIVYHSGTPGSLNNESLSGIFFEWAGAPRKMLVTQAAMARLLAPPVRSLGRMKSPNGLRAYGFQARGRTVIVAWAMEGTEPAQVSLATTDWEAVDVQGNALKGTDVTVTRRPVYFVAVGMPPKDLPW